MPDTCTTSAIAYSEVPCTPQYLPHTGYELGFGALAGIALLAAGLFLRRAGTVRR